MTQEFIFKGRSFTLLAAYFHGILLLTIYIAYAIVVHQQIEPYLTSIGNFLNAKGALLMIIISIPFLLIFFTLFYNIYKYLIFNKITITIKFEDDKIILNLGNKKKQISRDQLLKSTFFIEKLSQKTNCIIMKTKSNNSYIILSQKNERRFQEFIKNYEEYFNINLENLEVKDLNSCSVYLKKVIYHE